ncbi:DUF1217 domain-containing protein [Acuticoccus kandeliae]|uniref:DUF1217 domain-containing protein n=1 Tax=Acuticoccus kandeliae TaxID=2073160 RepID=UPI000D3E2B04|nr:DUF1217 domain-containing protein [Acuticoccus kandeliae]
MNVSVSYRLIAQNLDRSLAITASQGPVKLESEYYLENYRNISSIDEFLADTRLFRFAMTAYGLADLAFAKGYMRKILEEGVTEPDSLANRTSDNRLREFAAAFDFESFGDLTMRREINGQPTVDRYVRQTMEVDAGEVDGEGVRLALYFERMAPKIDSAFDILADAALFKVVRTVLGLPTAFSAIDIDRQAAVLEEEIDFESFSDPVELDRFLTRFTAVWDATEVTSTDPILSLFGAGGNASPTLSLDLAMSLQSFRLGGN